MSYNAHCNSHEPTKAITNRAVAGVVDGMLYLVDKRFAGSLLNVVEKRGADAAVTGNQIFELARGVDDSDDEVQPSLKVMQVILSQDRFAERSPCDGS